MPYYKPDVPLPQESMLLIGVPPFASCFAVLGLILLSSGIPSLLLLRSTQDSPALALLRAYRVGVLVSCVLFILAPFLYVALDILLFRVFRRKRDIVTAFLSIPAFTVLSLVMLFSIVVVAWGGGLWRAEMPKLYGQYTADIRQMESGTLEHMTVLLDENSVPGYMPGGPSDELTLHRRGASGPDSDFEWVILRFPDGLDFTPNPEGFVVIGETFGWNWDHGQKYEVFYTSEFHLVETITPIP